MNIHLIKAAPEDAARLHKMQIDSFAEMLSKYNDPETNPGNEPLELICSELSEPSSYFYFIYDGETAVGGIRVVIMPDGTEKRISPLFVLPEYRNRSIAQSAVRAAEKIHGENNWALETVMQEQIHRRLYEKLGYKFTGRQEEVNKKLTLGLFVK